VLSNKRERGSRVFGTAGAPPKTIAREDPILTALALFLQIIMQAEMDCFGQRFVSRILVKRNGFLEGVYKNQARMAVFHVAFQVLAKFRIQLTVKIFGKSLQDFSAFHSPFP